MGQATSQVCLSEVRLVSALLVEEPLITKVGLYSFNIKKMRPKESRGANPNREGDNPHNGNNSVGL
jgi:hypothetical protein